MQDTAHTWDMFFEYANGTVEEAMSSIDSLFNDEQESLKGESVKYS
jgi:hypothetical protein